MQNEHIITTASFVDIYVFLLYYISYEFFFMSKQIEAEEYYLHISACAYLKGRVSNVIACMVA